MNLSIFVDGGSRGNPGHSAIGVVIYDGAGTVVEEFSKYIGINTNNAAEYEALIAGLELAGKFNPKTIKIHMDSELIYNQMLGRYKVKNENMLKYFQTARQLVLGLKKVELISIPREKNTAADKLVNQALNIQIPLLDSQK